MEWCQPITLLSNLAFIRRLAPKDGFFVFELHKISPPKFGQLFLNVLNAEEPFDKVPHFLQRADNWQIGFFTFQGSEILLLLAQDFINFEILLCLSTLAIQELLDEDLTTFEVLMTYDFSC